MTNTKKTSELRSGDRVTVPATLNSYALTGEVEKTPEPWILTAGKYAGQQARSGRGNKGDLLWTVNIVGVTEDVAGGTRGQRPIRHDTGRVDFSAPADQNWQIA